jgi:hypothetical protein
MVNMANPVKRNVSYRGEVLSRRRRRKHQPYCHKGTPFLGLKFLFLKERREKMSFRNLNNLFYVRDLIFI